MKRIIFGIIALLWPFAALAQPSPPVDPWTVIGNQIYYNGCVTIPYSVAGGCKGNGSLNVSSLFVGGVAVSSPFSTVSYPLGIIGSALGLQFDANFTNNGSNQLSITPFLAGYLFANCTALGAEPGACSWNSFAKQAIGSTPGTIPIMGSSVWGTIVAGTGVAASLANNINANGGIISPTPTRAGDVAFWNGSTWVTLAGQNSATTLLLESASGVPSWTTIGTGLGVSGGALNCLAASTSQVGCAKFDGVTIALNGSGQLEAVGATATVVSIFNTSVTGGVANYLLGMAGFLAISSGTYNNSTGVVTLTMSAPITFSSGIPVTISSLTGSGAYASLNGTFTTLAGTTGSTVVYNAGSGLGASTITGGSLTECSGSPPCLANVPLPLNLASGGLGGSQSAATANQIPVFPGSGGAAVPTNVGGVGGLFDAVCSSIVGQLWVRLTGGWGCTSLGFSNPVWWGADLTGTASSSTAIASAQIASNWVIFPCGIYKVTTPVSPTSNQRLTAAAHGCVIVNESGISTSYGVFDIATTANNVTLENFTCGPFAGGTCVWQHGGQQMMLNWIAVAGNMFACLRIDDYSGFGFLNGGLDVQYHVDHHQCNAQVTSAGPPGTTTYGILVGADSSGTGAGTYPVAGLYIDHTTITNATSSTGALDSVYGGCGIMFIQGSGNMIDHTDILASENSICTYPGTGKQISSTMIANSFLDSPTMTNLVLRTNGNGTVGDMDLASVQLNGGGSNGALIDAVAGTISGIRFRGSHIANGNANGACIMASNGGLVTNVYFDGVLTEVTSGSSYQAYALNGSVFHIQFNGGQATGNPFTGVYIANATTGFAACNLTALHGAGDYVSVNGLDTIGATGAPVDNAAGITHLYNHPAF